MRKLSTNAFYVFIGDAGARALGFLASAHLARALDADGFGVITIGFAFLSYVFWFADLGLGTLGTREIGKEPGDRQFEMDDILSARILLAGTVFLPALVLALLLYRAEPERTVVASYLVGLLSYSFLLEWYYQGIQHYRPLVLSRTLTGGIYFLALYFLVSSPDDLPRVPWLYALSTFVPSVILLFFKRKGDRFLPRRFSLARALATIKRAGSIGVGGIFAQTVQLLPPLVLGYYSMEETGLLGAAMRIMTVLLIVDRVFVTLFLPAISRLWSRERAQAREYLERMLGFIIAAGFLLATLVMLHAEKIMTLVFGTEFRAGAATLALLGWFAAITLANSVFSFGLIGAGKEREYFRATVTGGVIAALLTLALVPLWRLTGAALAILLSEVCVVILTYLEFRRHAAVRFMRPLGASALASAAVIAGAWGLWPEEKMGLSLWFSLPIALLLTGLILLLGGIRKHDILWLMHR